jgi:hypothetical protein
MNTLNQLVRRALETSGRVANACVFPTILAEWPREALERKPGTTRADVAIAYLSRSGFKCDRTRMNLRGYPGLLRELNEPPPWIEVTPEDVEGPLPSAREHELRPLYIQANEAPVCDLAGRFRDHLEGRQSTMTNIGIELPADIDALVELFEEKIELARCLGVTDFESLYNAVLISTSSLRLQGRPTYLYGIRSPAIGSSPNSKDRMIICVEAKLLGFVLIGTTSKESSFSSLFHPTPNTYEAPGCQ